MRALHEQFTQVLAPRRAHSTECSTGSSIPRNNAWLRAHKHEYAGRWVALRDGALLGSDEDQLSLYRKLKERGELEDAAFARL